MTQIQNRQLKWGDKNKQTTKKPPQIKEQENSQEEVNKMKIRNLSDMEFSIMMAKKLNSMRKYFVTMEKYQMDIKNDIALLKNTLEGLHNRLKEAKNWVSELEVR